MDAPRTLQSWQEAFPGDRQRIIGCRFPDGERFVLVPITARLVVSGSAPRPFPRLVDADQLRAELARDGLSEADIDARLQLAREWMTTFTPA